MANERLKDFPALASPATDDIIYVGDTSNSDNEVKVTVENLIGVYPSLLNIGALSVAAGNIIYTTGIDVWAATSITAFGRSFIALANSAAAQIALGLVIGTDVQAYSAALTSIAGLTTAANKMIYTTASDTYATTDLSAVARTMLAQTSNPLILSTIGALPTAGGTMSGQIDMGAQRIVNMADPVNPQDAVTLAYFNSGSFLPLAGGTMSGTISMGSNKITNMLDPTNNQDAATKFYTDNQLTNYLPLAGGTMAGVINMNSNKITGLAAPTNSGDATNKSYVDSVAVGLTVQQACYAATTANLAGYTYANGASGIGATLTAGSNGAFSLDGTSPALSARILVKDQSTTYQNGIYYLSTVGDGSNPAVLTRATDYDQPSEIQPGDLVLITNGTTNGGASFMETLTVTAIGTDPIVFSQFTYSASNVLLKSNNLSDVASTTTSFNNISPLTTKGDILCYSTTNARLAVGASNGQILQVNSGAATGLAWSTPTYPSTSGAAGKIIISDGTNYIASTSLWANTVGAAGKVVISDGTSNVYSTPTFPNASASSGKFIRSDGTNWIASTPTLPTSAGAAGKLLQSDGTNYIESTPTYPSASGSSGKFLISDGTNIGYSTSTIPTSAGATANKVLLSDGTNYVLSTPTFPNASATTRKIIVSDGTNWTASTETYATPGASGNVLTSDGTNWTSAAPAGGTSKVVKRVSTQTGAVATGGTVMPNDDTIPQNTEGDQYMTQAITPANSSNILQIDITAFVSSSASTQIISMAIFQDSTANALAAVSQRLVSSTVPSTVTWRHTMTAGTTSATTFKLRMGNNGVSNTMTFNGVSGGRLYGGVCASSITITEFTP